MTDNEIKDSALTGVVRWYGCHFNHPGQWRVVGWLRQFLKLRAEGERVVSARGLQWQLNPSDHMQSAVFWMGQMDRWEIYHLNQCLNGDWVLLDIGANFGFYSITLAAHARSRGRVLAFEPQPDVFERLQSNVQLNHLESQISLFSRALSDRSGMTSLTSHEGNTGKASLADTPGSIPMQRLDDFANEQRLDRIDAIKMDVEGAEMKVLTGATEALKKFRPTLLVEVNPVALARHGTSAKEFGERLKSLGYDLFEIHRARLERVDGFSDQREMINVLCRAVSIR